MTLKGGIFLALPLCLLVASGCGSNENPTTAASVSGKVTYKGEPVPAGLVNFVPKTQGPSATGSLNSDGTYSIQGAPVGDFTVTIDTEYLNRDKNTPAYPKSGGKTMADSTPANAPKPAAGKYVKIPKKYTDGKDSPLTQKLTAGQQTANFTLEDK